MLELLVLLVSITVILIFIYYIQRSPTRLTDLTHLTDITEPYQNFYLSSCPSGYKSFYDNNGDINCCDGEILGKNCLSNNFCTLNGKGVTNCTEILRTLYKNKAAQLCTPSMPNYFEDNAMGIKGCMSGELNDTMTGPQNNTQAKCVIYNTLEENTNSMDSCSNQKLLEAAQCFGTSCSKQFVQPSVGAPPFVTVQFTDNIGMPHLAYVRASYENWLNVVHPAWRDLGLDHTNNIYMAETAKAFYIDKTLRQQDIHV